MRTVRRSLKQQIPDVVKDYKSGELHSCYRLFEALQPIRAEHHGVDEGRGNSKCCIGGTSTSHLSSQVASSVLSSWRGDAGFQTLCGLLNLHVGY